MYLTVLGTSAESADGGQVGRGNRASGLITFCRPMTMEAIAGKNPVSHVGKVYSMLAQQTAETIYRSVEGLEEVHLWLCSRIGNPIDEPWCASVQVALASGAVLEDVTPAIEALCRDAVKSVGALCTRLTRGELSVC
jgi:S-adenosylmethionine synthetase